MALYALAQLSLLQLQELAEIEDRGVLPELWEAREQGLLTEQEKQGLSLVRKSLLTTKTLLLNEATIWARAIYPLLTMAERENIRAYSEVSLAATTARGELRGAVDGALARMDIEGKPSSPYLLIVEAKRGVEGSEPVAQLLGGLLCAAWNNHKHQPRTEQVLYGVYTVADVWTFLRASVTRLDSDRPLITATASREYYEQTEAGTIVLLLKSITTELLTR